MRKRTAKYLSIGLILILALLLLLYFGLRALESTVWSGTDDGAADLSAKTITVDGVSYFPKQDVAVFMLLGIDKSFETHSEDGNDYSADMVALLIFDEAEETYSVLMIDRNAAVEFPVLNSLDDGQDTAYGRLASAYTYGTGKNDSCENVKDALQALMSGLTIDHYIAMDMDAICIMNDTVGGVTVTMDDDLSEQGLDFPMGSVTLTGQQAVDYLRAGRDDEQLNPSCTERQKEYMQSFIKSLRKLKDSDMSSLLSAFKDIREHIVTDCSATVLSGFFDKYMGYEQKEVMSLVGEDRQGEKAAGYCVDEDELLKIRLKLFYAQK